MNKISIRTRITLWYSAILLSFLYLGVLGSYNAMSDILTQQYLIEMEKGSKMLMQHIEESTAEESLAMFDKENIPEDLSLIFWGVNNGVLVGKYQNWMLDPPKLLNRIQQINRGEETWFLYDNEVYKEAELVGWTRSVINMTHIMNLLDLMKERGILFIFPNLLLSALGGFLVTRWALKPIKKIAKAAREIGSGDLNQRIELNTANDEIGELVQEFNQMAEQLFKLIEREKQFSTDVSHEIRTPIAVIITQAEYSLENHHLSKESEKALTLIVEKGQQIQKMLSQLMFLSREREQSAIMELERINLTDVVADIADQYLFKENPRHITLDLEMMPDTYVQGDLMLLSRMINNLIDNGFRYGKEYGHLFISVKRDEETKVVTLLVIDDGIGITRHNLPLIFDRFFRGDQSRTAEGSGLGLSFVKLIVELHHGRISVDSHVGKGTAFKIEIPAVV